MRDLARAEAIRQGPKLIDVNGKKKVAFALTKENLKHIYETAGYNTDGIAWLKQIIRWRILGELPPKDEVVLCKK